MSLFLQIALGVLVAGGIGLGAWKHHESVRENREHARVEDQAATSATLSTGSGNSDLDKDMLTIDGQLKVIEQSSGDVDQSIHDKPINE